MEINTLDKCLMKKKVVPKLQKEVKVDIVTSDDIKIYYTEKFQDFTATCSYITNACYQHFYLFRRCFQKPPLSTA